MWLTLAKKLAVPLAGLFLGALLLGVEPLGVKPPEWALVKLCGSL